MPTNPDAARESRLRRRAARLGLAVDKSRSRTPEHPDYGTYQLIDPDSNTLVAYGLSSGYGLTLDDVEAALNE